MYNSSIGTIYKCCLLLSDETSQVHYKLMTFGIRPPLIASCSGSLERKEIEQRVIHIPIYMVLQLPGHLGH